MPINPAVRPDSLNNPTQRANSLNDPQFSEQQGYFGYDLTHGEYITPRFGEGTPTLYLDTVPGDRTVVHDNTKLILNQINGNLLSTVNQYVDSFYVPLRAMFPNNYEKLIPTPTKGDDLPLSATPQIPFFYWLNQYIISDSTVTLAYGDSYYEIANNVLNEISFVFNEFIEPISPSVEADYRMSLTYAIGRLIYLSTIISRGQLLDYLGIQLDAPEYDENVINSRLQQYIDDFYRNLWLLKSKKVAEDSDTELSAINRVNGVEIPLTEDFIQIDNFGADAYVGVFDTLPQFRNALSDILERGYFPNIEINYDSLITRGEDTIIVNETLREFIDSAQRLVDLIRLIVFRFDSLDIETLDEESDPFKNGGFLNITKPLAYQLAVAHYFTNDSVDNIFTAELYMQNLRACMFPTDTKFTREPIFSFNGVQTEYDYISCAGWYYSLMDDEFAGFHNRSMVIMSLLFIQRRTLRYGDYFSTARPRMLAVGQLFVNLSTDPDTGATGVSPIDITKNLLMQRYLNAANYVGSKFLNYYASFYGVTPSDTGTFPRFLAHRKIELQNQLTNNTADNQGAQTTNLVGHSDNNAFDVFIDDFGVIMSITSFDVLPVYTSGIDNTYHFADRFDYFNPMLQNVGDQPIRFSELCGYPQFYEQVFGYTMRNAEYKFKTSRAHGAFVNSLPGFLLKYPFSHFGRVTSENQYKITPNFIRDKPYYFDSIVPQMTGVSPGEYFHFVCACLNQVHCARKIQAQPPVLF